MGLLILFSFAAGVITVLSPCVLPVLPVVLSGSVGGGRLRPLGIITGFLSSFSILTLALTFFVRSFRINPELLRTVAAAAIILMAVILVVPALKDRFMIFAGSLLGGRRKVRAEGEKQGFVPGLFAGVSLGVVWTPCVGPIMASVITLAISSSVDAGAVAITLAYAFGTALPLFAVMQGGRALLNRFPGLSGRLGSVQRVFGVLMLITGIALLGGWDRSFQIWMLDTFPGYGSSLTAFEDNPAVRKALEERSVEKRALETRTSAAGSASGSNADVPQIPDRTGSDPLVRTSGEWFNSSPLTLEGLKGKVVLVDFWTYSCVNCLRTLPYLRVLHEKYSSEGLVLVGVHTPEFAFERDPGNVEKAIAKLGVAWPVVQDNDFGIWNAFSNRYWPAHYLFDRDGVLVSTHFGEGGYAEIEALVRDLLDLPKVTGGAPVDGLAEGVPDAGGTGVNPETYLGSERGQSLVSDNGVYRAAGKPGRFGWNLDGPWLRDADYVESTGNGMLTLDFNAREVYLVVSTIEGETAEVTVLVDGKPVGTDDVKGGMLRPAEDRLYRLVSTDSARKAVLTLTVRGRVRFHAFTFS